MTVRFIENLSLAAFVGFVLGFIHNTAGFPAALGVLFLGGCLFYRHHMTAGGRQLNPLTWLLSRPRVVEWIVARSHRTPYTHIDGYMNRYWLFNPYHLKKTAGRYSWRRWCPWSIRVHHILREDRDAHLHDHPWNARTVILRGWYLEAREANHPASMFASAEEWRRANRQPTWRYMMPGDTSPVLFNTFHKIAQVSDGGVLTLFITGPYLGDWGFKVDGRKVFHTSGAQCARCAAELPL